MRRSVAVLAVLSLAFLGATVALAQSTTPTVNAPAQTQDMKGGTCPDATWAKVQNTQGGPMYCARCPASPDNRWKLVKKNVGAGYACVSCPAGYRLTEQPKNKWICTK